MAQGKVADRLHQGVATMASYSGSTRRASNDTRAFYSDLREEGINFGAGADHYQASFEGGRKMGCKKIISDYLDSLQVGRDDESVGVKISQSKDESTFRELKGVKARYEELDLYSTHLRKEWVEAMNMKLSRVHRVTRSLEYLNAKSRILLEGLIQEQQEHAEAYREKIAYWDAKVKGERESISSRYLTDVLLKEKRGEVNRLVYEYQWPTTEVCQDLCLPLEYQGLIMCLLNAGNIIGDAKERQVTVGNGLQDNSYYVMYLRNKLKTLEAQLQGSIQGKATIEVTGTKGQETNADPVFWKRKRSNTFDIFDGGTCEDAFECMERFEVHVKYRGFSSKEKTEELATVLGGKALDWYRNIDQGIKEDWEDVKRAFLSQHAREGDGQDIAFGELKCAEGLKTTKETDGTTARESDGFPRGAEGTRHLRQGQNQVMGSSKEQQNYKGNNCNVKPRFESNNHVGEIKHDKQCHNGDKDDHIKSDCCSKTEHCRNKQDVQGMTRSQVQDLEARYISSGEKFKMQVAGMNSKTIQDVWVDTSGISMVSREAVKKKGLQEMVMKEGRTTNEKVIGRWPTSLTEGGNRTKDDEKSSTLSKGENSIKDDKKSGFFGRREDDVYDDNQSRILVRREYGIHDDEVSSILDIEENDINYKKRSRILSKREDGIKYRKLSRIFGKGENGAKVDNLPSVLKEKGSKNSRNLNERENGVMYDSKSSTLGEGEDGSKSSDTLGEGENGVKPGCIKTDLLAEAHRNEKIQLVMEECLAQDIESVAAKESNKKRIIQRLLQEEESRSRIEEETKQLPKSGVLEDLKDVYADKARDLLQDKTRELNSKIVTVNLDFRKLSTI
ncbi:hypothetical protein [Parasitella parasitica]|uniref:Retrotransposon gag domain-containing protein n=1 Tax=Parasitella parasitica TaxID=35722 RepID=A0A0B7NBM2_9FUNG|nr:hypothetical protein [Parasitella parasitica]